MEYALLPGTLAAKIMYGAGFEREVIILRLTDRAYMEMIGEHRLTEGEAAAAYDAVVADRDAHQHRPRELC
jgi:hypothetical protein